MQTMKDTVNPAMLQSLASIPASESKPQQPMASPYGVQRSGYGSEDVHMKTAKMDTKLDKPRGLELWEREMLQKTEVRRKTTVAQICE